MNLVEAVRAAGVVGAGGGGFPTHVKLAGPADTVIANGAECEPLLHKDAALLEHRAQEVVTGLQLVMDAVGAKEGIVGIKAKNRLAVDAVQAVIGGTGIRLQLLGDYYPAGDEYDLVHTATGRLIPPGGIPPQVGVVVSNVETLANVAAAARGQPVLQKTLTLAGAVRYPCTLTVPIGTSLHDCVQHAGGLTTDDPVLCLGGVMMGETTDNLATPVTKTLTGAVILPRDHAVIRRKLTPARSQARIGKSACDQCRYCTEYCPRYLLGYAVEPHQVMRSLGFGSSGGESWNAWAALCCACGLCTLYACPEELFPKEACDAAKAEMRRAGIKWSGPGTVRPHPLHDSRRVPIRSLVKRLRLQELDLPAPVRQGPAPARVELLLKQSAGAANEPLVRAGETVAAGQPVGAVPSGSLGAIVHAPFAAEVVSVTPYSVVLARIP